MSLPTLRRGLHASHALATLVLVGTGLLILWPDWRARLVGGFGREIAEVHLWAGWVYAGAPLLLAAVAGRALARDVRRRLAPGTRGHWPRLHLALTLATTALLSLTGVVLWQDAHLPLSLADAAWWLHSKLSWVVVAALGVHLLAARRRLAAWIREGLGRAAPPRLDPDDPTRILEGE